MPGERRGRSLLGSVWHSESSASITWRRRRGAGTAGSSCSGSGGGEKGEQGESPEWVPRAEDVARGVRAAVGCGPSSAGLERPTADRQTFRQTERDQKSCPTPVITAPCVAPRAPCGQATPCAPERYGPAGAKAGRSGAGSLQAREWRNAARGGTAQQDPQAARRAWGPSGGGQGRRQGRCTATWAQQHDDGAMCGRHARAPSSTTASCTRGILIQMALPPCAP